MRCIEPRHSSKFVSPHRCRRRDRCDRLLSLLIVADHDCCYCHNYHRHSVSLAIEVCICVCMFGLFIVLPLYLCIIMDSTPRSKQQAASALTTPPKQKQSNRKVRSPKSPKSQKHEKRSPKSQMSSSPTVPMRSPCKRPASAIRTVKRQLKVQDRETSVASSEHYSRYGKPKTDDCTFVTCKECTIDYLVFPYHEALGFARDACQSKRFKGHMHFEQNL